VFCCFQNQISSSWISVSCAMTLARYSQLLESSIRSGGRSVAKAATLLSPQEGQRAIAIHALENLAHSDTGIVMLRRLLREQLQRVEQGLDPINVIRDPSANKRIPTGAWNTILPPAEAAVLPYSEDL
jgi:hypothetical protein